MEQITDADIDAAWSATADIWVAGYDERGDANRKYISDSVVFEFLGDVRGRRILDAGSGGGYLCRLLAGGGRRW
jgi:2-polyprenyl-3-methyl-5-hydroxy-6-metoxy-1,4-benzoquinol methylase